MNGSFGYIQGTTKNAYLDTTAKSVGYAYLNGIIAHFDGTYWKPLTDLTKILSGDFIQQFSTTTSNIGGVANNGLIYTNTAAPFNVAYWLDHFGVSTWSSFVINSINLSGNATNICETRGMLLPLLNETQASVNPWGGLSYVPTGGSMGNANGIPSHPSGYTWTSTANSYYGNNFYWIWSGTGGSAQAYYDGAYYVRCVR